MNLVGPSRDIICIIYFCLSAVSLLLEVAGNTNAHVLKIDRACFYCLLGLEIIVCSNKGLWIRPSCMCWHDFTALAVSLLMLDFAWKMFFVSRLDIILLLFLYIQCPWHVLVPVLFTCGSNENGKIALLF